MSSEDSKGKAKANKFLVALATKIPLKSLSETTIVDLFENAVSSLEKGSIRTTLLSDLEEFFETFDAIVKKRLESVEAAGVQSKQKVQLVSAATVSQLVPLEASKQLLRSYEDIAVVERSPIGYLGALRSGESNISCNVLASGLLQSSTILQETPQNLNYICRSVLVRLAVRREWAQQSTMESVSCLWAFCAVLAYSGNSDRSNANQKLAEGCLLGLCSDSSQFLLYSLGYVGYWGIRLHREQQLKDKKSPSESSLNDDLVQLLLSLGASASAKSGEDIDTTDIALCLIASKVWLEIGGVSFSGGVVQQKMKSFLHTQMLAKLPVASSFWEEIIVPALDRSLDKVYAKKAVQKGLSTGNKVKEVVDWIVQSSNMQNACMKSLEQLVLSDETVEEQPAADSEDPAATVTTITAGAAPAAVDSEASSSATAGNEKLSTKKKVASVNKVSAADLIASTRLDEGGDEDDDEEGLDSMFDFTIDTAGDRSVLDSLVELVHENEIGDDDNNNSISALEQELGSGGGSSSSRSRGGQKTKRQSGASVADVGSAHKKSRGGNGGDSSSKKQKTPGRKK